MTDQIVQIDDHIGQIRTNPNLNKSQKIRSLYDLGVTRSEIAQILNIRYQFVRNVLNQIVKKKS